MTSPFETRLPPSANCWRTSPEDRPPEPPPPVRLPLVEPRPEDPRASELELRFVDRDEDVRELDDFPPNRDVAA